MREIIKVSLTDMACTGQIKSDSIFPDTHFKISNCQFPVYRRFKDREARGKLTFIKESLIRKIMVDFEAMSFEITCVQLTISNKG